MHKNVYLALLLAHKRGFYLYSEQSHTHTHTHFCLLFVINGSPNSFREHGTRASLVKLVKWCYMLQLSPLYLEYMDGWMMDFGPIRAQDPATRHLWPIPAPAIDSTMFTLFFQLLPHEKTCSAVFIIF